MQSQLTLNLLPISSHQKEIVELIKKEQVVVISGKTGCGKSTKVPQFILKSEPSAKIAVCQPRRVAATSLAIRVSQQMNCRLGTQVGYHIGLETFRGQKTSIIYMTYGILIQQLLFREELPYSHIILDQIHERSLEMDFTFVALKHILSNPNRKRAKIIVMSATLNAQEFANYFSIHKKDQTLFLPAIIPKVKEIQNKQQKQSVRGRRGRNEDSFQNKYEITQPNSQQYSAAATLAINENRQYRVEEYFLDEFKKQDIYSYQYRISEQSADFACELLKKIEDKYKEGDVLIFLPGIFQIRLIKNRLTAKYGINEKRIIEVHSLFSEELYDNLFNKKINNKIILATNIGESSITLPACKAVIDFCLSRKNFGKDSTVTKLETTLASKASLTQRSGRVGRVSDGVVYRMITSKLYATLSEYETPQIHCVSLEMVILKAKQLDMTNKSDIARNPYLFLMSVIDPPSFNDASRAFKNLIKQQALVGEQGVSQDIEKADQLYLTPIGKFMVSMPCDLQISKMILMGLKLRIPKLIISIGSILMSSKPFFAHEQKRENIEAFMHCIVGYDKGLFNDYLLRENLFDHWKQLFYEPVKQRNLYKKKVKNTEMDKATHGQYGKQFRIYESYDIEQEEIFKFLQDFNQEAWTEKERKWCLERAIYPNVMREIVKIEESIKFKIEALGYTFTQQEKISNQLVLLCLAYAFPDNTCQVVWSKELKNQQDPYYVDIKACFETGDDLIHDYCHPQKQYRIEHFKDSKQKRIHGSCSVLKKFLLPQFYQKSNLDKASELYYYLFKNKPFHRLGSEVIFQRRNIVVMNESINKATISPKVDKKYFLLTNKFTEIGDKKMVATSALIEEGTYHIIQLISKRVVDISSHPSHQFFSHFRIDGTIYDFTSLIKNQDISMINEMRKLARRQKNNNITSSEQVMSVQDVNRLRRLLENNQVQRYKKEPWQILYVQEMKMNCQQPFLPIETHFKLQSSNSFRQKYNKWKIQNYEEFYRFYRPITIEKHTIICKECYPRQIVEIQMLDLYDPTNNLLKLNQYSGSWIIPEKSKTLCCKNNHQIGLTISDQSAKLDKESLLIYYPYQQVVDFFVEWPSAEQLQMNLNRGLEELAMIQRKTDFYQCLFCFEYNDHTEEMMHAEFHRDQLRDNFWKKVFEHLRGYQHLNNLKIYKESLK